MTEKKEYPIPSEIQDVFCIAEAAKNRLSVYAKIPFCYRKARKSSIEYTRCSRKAWNMVMELYPELRRFALLHDGGIVAVMDKKGL